MFSILAKTPITQHRSVIQNYVDAMSVSIAEGLPIIVTPTLVKKITTL